MKAMLYCSLIVSAALFFTLGLPFLTRYTPWIPGPRDLYDPVADPARRLDYKPEAPKKKPIPIVVRTILVYCVLFVASFVGVGIYNLVK